MHATRNVAFPIVRFVMCCVAVLGSLRSLPAQTSLPPANPKHPHYWIFLTTGKSAEGIARTDLETMQKAHLDNFTRLHGEGKLFAAGPMMDPEKNKRGIVVATAPDKESLLKFFDSDPFVQNGLLTIDAIPIEIGIGTFHGAVDPKSLAEYHLIVLEKSETDTAELGSEAEAENLKYFQTLHAPDRLCFAAWLRDQQLPRRAILVFKEMDEKELNTALEQIPAVKGKLWKWTEFELYMSDGIVQ